MSCQWKRLVFAALSIAALLMMPNVVAAQISESPTALFTWSMPDRFGPTTKKGLVDYHWDPEDQTYDPSFVRPETWTVNFNACESTPKDIIQFYTWTIDGKALPAVNKCKFTYEFRNLGGHGVRLTVTTADNQTAYTEQSVNVMDYLIISIGDSIASGEGVPDIPKGEPGGVAWIYTRCHRSARAGHAKAALELEKSDPHSSVTFLSFACSGAELRKGLIQKQKKGFRTLPPQMEQVKRINRLRRIDALLVTIGGNDANFSRLVSKAIFKDDASTDRGTLKLFEKGLSTLQERFAALNDDIAKLFWDPKVFITEYPDIVRKSRNTFCDREPKDDRLRKITAKEAQWAAEVVVRQLNEHVATAAQKYGWVYVGGVAESFYDHGYCAGERWVHTFNDAREVQGTKGCTKSSLIHCIISAGSVHPNYDGQDFYAKRLGEVLRANGFGSPATEPGVLP